MAGIGPARARTRWRRRAPLAVLVLLALALPTSSFGTASIAEIHKKEKGNFDKRAASIAPTAEQAAAVDRLGGRSRWNKFGTPSSLLKDGGYLAANIAGASAGEAAKTFLGNNGAAFKLGGTDALAVSDDIRLPDSNGHSVVLRQSVGGLPVSPDGTFTVGVAGSSDAGWNVAYAATSSPGDLQLTGTPVLSLAEGWARAASAAGLSASPSAVSVSGESNGWTLLTVDGLAQEQSARLVAFPTGAGTAVPAWETTVLNDAGDVGYWQFVDAQSGDVLFRESIVDQDVDNPKWMVFPSYPHSALDEFPWNYPTADIRDLWCWFPDPACQYLPSTSLGTNGVEWDKDARTNTPTFTTRGNNANDSEAWFNSFGPGPTGFRPSSPTRDYVYPWTNVWYETRCNPANFVPGAGNDISAAVANLFAMHNRMHDWTYVLGFTEGRWNGQAYNFGRPFAENDPVLGQAQAGGANGGYPTYTGRDNANMATRPDGQSSITNMYLWQPLAGSFYAPCVDGDYDMTVIGHEYGHMVENRMIGKGNRRMGTHAGMMGESHGDLLAMEYVNEYNFVPTGGSDNPNADAATTLIGRYVTGNNERGIRNYDMAFSTGNEFPLPGRYPSTNPLNFSDVGYDITGPQVHADGEIWSATNFDLRELLLDRYPSVGQEIQRQCADGRRPVYECPGNRRWIQLLLDAFLLMPVRPTFLDARDAILAADVMRFGGANQDLLWLGFARRGFGQNAQNTNAEDFDPRPDFESPLHDEATVVFNAFGLNEGNAPIANANVYVGHYERGVTPVADTNPATPGPYLDNAARFVPDDAAKLNSRQRGYEFVVNAQGYGHVRFRLTELKPGETRVVNVYMPTNWASRYKGAVATGDGTRQLDLIDDTEGTNWESVGPPVQGRQVLVQLAGGAHRIDRAKVSAMLQPGQNRFVALREFEIYGCNVSKTGDVTIGGTTYACQRIVKSQPDAFPGASPRPVAPEMILRTWEAGAGQGYTHVLFRVLNNQCTGTDEFHGEQDNDPANTSTDCRIGTLPVLPSRANDVKAAELQVFSDKPRVDGAQAAD